MCNTSHNKVGGIMNFQFDEIISAPCRLGILATLVPGAPVSFTEMKAATSLSDGNLHTQTRKLADVGYIKSSKTMRGRRSVTNFSITDLGRERLRLHVVKLQQILDAADVGAKRPVQRSPQADADNPAAAREFVRLGATGLTSVAPAERPRNIPGDLARYIDHTLLKANATEEQIRKLCAEALEHNFRTVCINPTWVSLAASLLRGSEVLTCTVVGFPLGANEPEVKAMEARRAIRNGAREIDMVINIGALKGGNDALVLRDIQAVVEACVAGNAVCKVILETALLSDEEKRRASLLARTARAHFVKTSTGFSTGGATVSDVALMSEVARGTGMEVKASGGISSYDEARAMIAAGATRLGLSASIAIVQEAKSASLGA
jgi:deoxyribose-phosphate aldolase